jgi:acetylornithine/N-succinyldiaminopimelate aminotransferase
MPIGAICATEEVAKAFTSGSHGTTFGGHPVCCAAALAAIEEMEEKHLADNAARVGAYFMEKLKGLPHIKEVRGQGLLVGVEFDGVNAVEVKHKCFDRKLLITAIGESVIRMVPPLIITEADCDKAVEIIKDAVEEAAV